MRDVLVVRHAPHEGPGYLADYLRRRGIPQRLLRIDRGEAVPTRLDGLAGVVLMGGPMSANDDLPWIPAVTRLISAAVAANVPVLGHCLGGQLISTALGGRVTRHHVKEIGWFPVTRVENAEARDWLGALPREFEAFHWHGETFSIPPRATRILASRDCANQAFVLGPTLALQCHVEMTVDMVHEWARLGVDEIARPSATVQDVRVMTADLATRVPRLQRLADRLYDRWCRGLVQ